MTDGPLPPRTVVGRGVGYGAAAGAALSLLVMGVLSVLSVAGGPPAPENEVIAVGLVVASTVGLVTGAAAGLLIAALILRTMSWRGPRGARAVAAGAAGLGAMVVSALALGLQRPAGEMPSYVAAVLAVAAVAALVAWLLAPMLVRPTRGSAPRP
jgi:hypothetical protein